MSEAATTSTTPPATPAPSASASTPGSAPASTDWTSGFSDEMRGYVQNKGFKGTQDVLESYRNFEKLHGVPQDRILKLPENLDSPEGKAIFERLGAPKDAKDYKIEIPKENGDPKLADWFRDVAAKNNLTHKQLENLVTAWNERTGGSLRAAGEQHQARINEAQANLKKEWGSAFEQNKLIADQAATVLGMSEAEVKALGSAIGPDKAMMLLHKFGTATGEAKFVIGDAAGSGKMSPDQAKSKLSELKNDQVFRERLIKKDADAVQQWNKLNLEAYPPA